MSRFRMAAAAAAVLALAGGVAAALVVVVVVQPARWDGQTWTVQPTPAPSAGGQLEAVSCTSATACTAVGEAYRKPVPGDDTQPAAW